MSAAPHSLQIRRILDKLGKAQRGGFACFGSESHKFKLGPKLSEQKLRAFESEHGVTLPPGYRAFLLEAGHGGAGPYYGLYTLDRIDDCPVDKLPADFLQRSSPLRVGSNTELMRETSSDAEYEAANLERYQGTMSIGSQGCSYTIQLIVSGACRGRVAYFDGDSHSPPYVVRQDDFLDWYERWLDELLAGYRDSWFGYGPGGDGPALLAIIADESSGDDLKGEAARALSGVPGLDESARAQIPALMRHTLPEVRAGACSALEAFDLPAAPAAGLLNDSVASVRRAAVWALMKRAPADYASAIKAMMLTEPDDEVAGTAFFRLKDADAFSRAELLQMIAQGFAPKLRSLAVWALEWRDEDWPLGLSLLSDADDRVQLNAALGLRGLAPSRAATPTLLACLERERDETLVGHILYMLADGADAAAADALVHWCAAPDDFHRLDALRGLIRIGDARANAIAQAMLNEDRKPERHTLYSSMSHSKSIRTLVREMLREARPKLASD